MENLLRTIVFIFKNDTWAGSPDDAPFTYSGAAPSTQYFTLVGSLSASSLAKPNATIDPHSGFICIPTGSGGGAGFKGYACGITAAASGGLPIKIVHSSSATSTDDDAYAGVAIGYYLSTGSC